MYIYVYIYIYISLAVYIDYYNDYKTIVYLSTYIIHSDKLKYTPNSIDT